MLKGWNSKARRLITWFAETLTEAILFSVLMVGLSWHDIAGPGTPAYNAVITSLLTAIFVLFYLFLTGYMLTTGLCRFYWRGRRLWSYPICAVLLFFFHFELFNAAMGGVLDPRARILFRIFGACIVLMSTLVGGLALERVAHEQVPVQ
jgi:hypothetical protein